MIEKNIVRELIKKELKDLKTYLVKKSIYNSSLRKNYTDMNLLELWAYLLLKNKTKFEICTYLNYLALEREEFEREEKELEYDIEYVNSDWYCDDDYYEGEDEYYSYVDSLSSLTLKTIQNDFRKMFKKIKEHRSYNKETAINIWKSVEKNILEWFSRNNEITQMIKHLSEGEFDKNIKVKVQIVKERKLIESEIFKLDYQLDAFTYGSRTWSKIDIDIITPTDSGNNKLVIINNEEKYDVDINGNINLIPILYIIISKLVYYHKLIIDLDIKKEIFL